MTYPGSHLLVSWLFGITGTDEIAMTSLRCTNVADPFGFIALDAQAAIDSADLTVLANAMNTLLTNAGYLWGSWSELRGMKVASIGPTGSYLGDAAVGDVVPVKAGTSNVPVPAESVVLTLDSGTRFGHATTGRMYLPHCRNASSTSGSPYMQGVAGMLAAAKTFMSTVRTQMRTLPGEPEPAIVSQFGAGTANAIVQLSMDNILDVQRRRKDQLRGTRSFTPFP